MSVKNRPLAQLLKRYTNNPKMHGAFGQQFGKNLIASPKYQQKKNKAYFLYNVPASQKNVIDVMHGGALSTLIDVATTVAILKMSPRRTISISLNTQFMSPIKINSQISVETQVTKLGRNIAFTECKIYTYSQDSQYFQQKLACKGSHIKALLEGDFQFMKEGYTDF